MNLQMAEQQKVSKCVEALADRLVQSVPPQHVAQARAAIQMRFAEQMRAEGLTPEEFMRSSGATPQQMSLMFDEQALRTVECDAALSAFAQERKLKVDELEYGRALGLSPADLKQVLDQARANGRTEQLREAALQGKAAQLVVAECSCTYRHESEAQAKARVAQVRAMQRRYEEQFGGEGDGDGGGDAAGKGFKLV